MSIISGQGFGGKVKNYAFSLIELMITVMILGILTAIAMPQYRMYTIRAKIGTALTTLQYINQVIVQKYDQSTLKATVTIGDATLVNGVASTYAPATNVPMAAYHNGVNGIPANEVLTCVYISGLDAMKITTGLSYIAPTSSSRGQRAGMCLLSVLTSGAIIQHCGIWTPDLNNGGNDYIPPEYLLPSCSATIKNFV